jgi:hypothetical protein
LRKKYKIIREEKYISWREKTYREILKVLEDKDQQGVWTLYIKNLMEVLSLKMTSLPL